jgi:hypothetical protein
MNRRMLSKSVKTLAIAGIVSICTANLNAAIISNPASILDHGTYITDKTSGLNYLKFASTLGLSFNEAVANNALAGWQAATGAQVQSLVGLFGWVSDTPSPAGGVNANAGLTDAVASYMGYTTNNTTDTSCCGNRAILATTADYRSPGVNWDSLLQIDVATNSLNDQVSMHYVNSDEGVVSQAIPWQATWLVQTVPVPEPESYAMLLAGLGLIGTIALRRRKSDAS